MTHTYNRVQCVTLDSINHSPLSRGTFIFFFFIIYPHWKRLWCWEGLGAGGKGDDRGWDGWMASLTRWTWVWVNSRSWWWTGRPGMLRFMESQRVGHDWVTELNWSDPFSIIFIKLSSSLDCSWHKGNWDSVLLAQVLPQSKCPGNAAWL